MPTYLDRLREKYPELTELGISDEELLSELAKARGVSPDTMASFTGVQLPDSPAGNEWEAGKAGFGLRMHHLYDFVTDNNPDEDPDIRRLSFQQQFYGQRSPAPQSYTDIQFGDDQQGVTDYVRRLALQSAPEMGATVAGGLGGALLTGGSPLGAAAGGFAAGLPSAAGEILGTQYEEAGRYGTAGEVLPKAAAFSAVNMLGVEAPAIRLGLKAASGSLLRRVPQKAFTTGAEESAGEGIQQWLVEQGVADVDPTHDPYGPEAIQRYKEAAVGGFALGGSIGAVYGLPRRPDEAGGRSSEDTDTGTAPVPTVPFEPFSPVGEQVQMDLFGPAFDQPNKVPQPYVMGEPGGLNRTSPEFRQAQMDLFDDKQGRPVEQIAAERNQSMLNAAAGLRPRNRRYEMALRGGTRLVTPSNLQQDLYPLPEGEAPAPVATPPLQGDVQAGTPYLPEGISYAAYTPANERLTQPTLGLGPDIPPVQTTPPAEVAPAPKRPLPRSAEEQMRLARREGLAAAQRADREQAYLERLQVQLAQAATPEQQAELQAKIDNVTERVRQAQDAATYYGTLYKQAQRRAQSPARRPKLHLPKKARRERPKPQKEKAPPPARQPDLFPDAPEQAAPVDNFEERMARAQQQIKGVRDQVARSKKKSDVAKAVRSLADTLQDTPMYGKLADLMLEFKLDRKASHLRYRKAALPVLDEVARQLKRSYKNTPEDAITRREQAIERAAGRADRTGRRYGEQLEQAKDLKTIARVLAEVDTQVPAELKTSAYTQQVDKLYEALEFGDWVPAHTKRKVAKFLNTLPKLLQEKSLKPRQLSLFTRIEQDSKRAHKPGLTAKERSELERRVVRGIQDYINQLVESGKHTPENALAVTLDKLRKAKIPVPEAFLSEEAVRAMYRLRRQHKQWTRDDLPEEVQAVLGRLRLPTTAGTATEEAAEELGVGVADRLPHRKVQIVGTKHPTKKQLKQSPEAAKAKYTVRKAEEAVGQLQEVFPKKLGWKVKHLNMERVLEVMARTRYPDMEAFKTFADEWKSARGKVEDADTRLTQLLKDFETYLADPETVYRIAGRAAALSVEGVTNVKQLFGRIGLLDDYASLQDYVQNGLTEDQKAAAQAADLQVGKVKATPGKVLEITQYLGENPRYVKRETYRQGGKSALSDAQLRGANIALAQLLHEGDFLLNDATGFGKTRQLLAVADQFAQQTGEKVMIVHTGTKEGVEYQQLVREAEAMGVDLSRFTIRTYGYFNENTDPANYGLVIWDEAQNLKATSGARQQNTDAVAADRAMYVTATLADTAGGMTLLARLAGMGLDELVASLGMVPKTGNFELSRLELLPGNTYIGAALKLAKLYQQLGREGKLLRRQYAPRAKIVRKVVEPDKLLLEKEQRLLELAPKVDPRKKEVLTNAFHFLADTAKAQAVVDTALKEVSAGRKVIIVLPRVTGKGEFVLPLRDGTEELIALPNSLRQIEQALNKAGVGFIPYYGNKQAGLERFQTGDVPVLITTHEKGGVSIDLDDQAGSAPRTMIVSQPPFSAIAWTQTLGRIDRHGTKSTPAVVLLDAELEGDRRAQNILREKLRIQNAVSLGVPQAPGYLQSHSAYKVRYDRDNKFKRVYVEVSLNTPEDVTAVLSQVMKSEGKAKFITGKNVWRMTETAWMQLEPRLTAALEAIELGGRQTELGSLDLPRSNTQDVWAQKVIGYLLDRMARGDQLSGQDILETLQLAMPKGPRRHPLQALIDRLAKLKLDVKIDLKDSPGGRLKRQVRDGKIHMTILLGDAHLHTFLHEMVHAATATWIDTASEAQLRGIKGLMARAEVVLGEQHPYAFKDLREFVAEAFSNVELQHDLSLVPKPKRNLFARIVQWVRRILGGDIQVSLLEEVMQAGARMFSTQEQIEQQARRAVREGRAIAKALELPAWAALGPDAEGVLSVARAMDRLAPTFEEAKDKVRSLAKLPVMTFRQIAESYAKDFQSEGTNLLLEYVKTGNLKTRMARSLQRKADFINRDIGALEREDPDAALSLYQLIGDVTTHRIAMGDGAKFAFNGELNKHLRVDTNGKALPESVVRRHREKYNALKRRWDALPKQAKALYQELQQYYENHFTSTVQQVRENILTTANLPFTVTEAEVRGLGRTQLRELFEARLPEDAGKTLRTVVDEVVDSLAIINNKSKLQGHYFPLQRFGDYVVEATNAWQTEKVADKEAAARREAELLAEDRTRDVEINETPQGFEVVWRDRAVLFFENRQEAMRGIEELKTRYDEVTQPTLREKYPESKGLSGVLIERVASRLDNPHLEAAVRTAFIQMMPDTSIRKAELQRQDVAGYSLDMRRTFAAHAESASFYLAQLKYGRQLASQLEALKRYVTEARKSGSPRQPAMQQVVNELQKRDNLDLQQLTPSKVMDTASNVGFLWMLFTPSYWFVNMTQPAVITGPWLNARMKGNGYKALTKAWRAISPEIRRRVGRIGGVIRGQDTLADISDFLTEDGTVGGGFIRALRQSKQYSPKMVEELEHMLNKLGESGIIDMTFVADLNTAAEGRDKGMIARTTEWARIMPHLVEVLNRTSTAIAAYEMARKNGKGVEAAIEFADDAVASTQFDYSSWNKPRYFSERQFRLARPAFMFMQYSQHMYYLMLRSIVQGSPALKKRLLGGKLTEEEKAEARAALRTFTGIVATHAVFGGVIGATFEPIKWAIGLAAWVASLITGDDEPWDYETEVRQFFAGLFGKEFGQLLAKGPFYAAGVDLSTRINLNNLLFFDDGGNKEGREWLSDKAFGLFGPLGGIAGNWADALVAMRRGDYWRAAERLSPKLVRDALQTAEFTQYGVRDTSGKVILKSEELGPFELFMKSVGINPADPAEVYARRRAVRTVEEHYSTLRGRLMEQYNRARTAGERQEIMGQVRQYNKRAPASMRIKYGDLIKSVQRYRKAQRDVDAGHGVYTSHKRRELLAYGDF